MKYLLRLTLAGLLAVALSGCTVITVAGLAAGAAITAADLAVDAAVGTVKLTGKAVGAMVPDDDEEEQKQAP